MRASSLSNVIKLGMDKILALVLFSNARANAPSVNWPFNCLNAATLMPLPRGSAV